MERVTRRQSMELHKRAKLNFVLMYVSNSEYESSFLSLIPQANLCIAFDADEPSPSVQQKINGQKLVFSTSIILCSYFSFLMDWWYLKESGMILGQFLLYGLNTFTTKNILCKRNLKKPLALISSRASPSIVVVLSAKLSLAKSEDRALVRYHRRPHWAGWQKSNGCHCVLCTYR